MKAIQYSQLGNADVLSYVDLPDPQPSPGEVIMRVKAAAMNHLDLHFRRGLPGMKGPLPHTPGSDGAGIVEAVGEGVTNVKAGDRILMNPGVSCGNCDRCGSGEISYCHKYYVLGRETEGTYAELMRMPARNAILIPENLSFEHAAAVPLVYLTAWSMVVTKAKVQPGETVLIMGAGSGVSMAAIQIAKAMGATVITTASTDEKINKAQDQLGADFVINYKKEAIDKACRKWTDRVGVDVALDHIGGDQWVPVLRATRNGGRVVTCGATAGFEPTEDLRQIFYRQLQVFGSTMGNDHELLSVLRLIFSGKVTPVIDSTFALKDAKEAHLRMESRAAFGKVIIQP